MSKPFPVSGRRIDRLRQLAYDYNLTNEEARKYGKLTVTKTWEALLSVHGLEFEKKSDSEPLFLDKSSLYAEVCKLREAGKSQTWIIENILKMKGRKFAEGKVKLQNLLSPFEEG